MKQVKLLIALLLFTTSAFAQSVKIQPWQLWKGTPGNVVIIGVDSFQKDTSSWFLAAADTMLLHNQIVLKQNKSDTLTYDATKADLNTGLALKEDLANKATTLTTSNNTLYPTTKAAKDNDISAASFSGTTTKTLTLTRPNGNITATFTDNNTTYTAGWGLTGTTTFVVDSTKVVPLDPGGKVGFQYLPATLMIYKGVWNGTTNTPTLSDAVGTTGWVYEASWTGGADSVVVNLGTGGSRAVYKQDHLIYNGTMWEVSRGGNLVFSVNGKQGVVSLSTSDIPEGFNLYFTNTRSRQSISASGDLSYNNTTGVMSYTTPSSLPPSGTAGGDLSGSYPNPTVAKLNGQLPSYYLDRSHHTGTQAQSTINNLQDSLNAKVQKTTQVIAGNGMTGGGALNGNVTVTMGTPSNITLSSTNSVTSTSHTHAFVPGGTSSQYIRGDGQLATLSPIGTLNPAEEYINGSQLVGGTTWTLSHTPSNLDFFDIWYRGVQLKLGTDYTVSGTTLTFNTTYMDHITSTCTFDIKYRY